MIYAIAIWRGQRFVLHLVYGLLIALFYPALSSRWQRQILRHWSASLLSILNVRTAQDSLELTQQLPQGLIVCNHISWLDVFVLNAVIPMRFVAKADVRGWPVFGWLCARAQTLFIERGSARAAARMNVQLVALLKRGECLAVFPEGTTSDGAQVEHFHASLLQPAIDAAVPLHPIALRYQDADGRRSEVAAYVGEQSFGASLWQILCAQNLQVQLCATPVCNTQLYDRRELARLAQQQISQCLSALAAPDCAVTKTSLASNPYAISAGYSDRSHSTGAR